jgi:thiol:disulfide interchange protein
VKRLGHAAPLLVLAACSAGERVDAPRQEIEILAAPQSSSSALALLRSVPKAVERSERGHWYADEATAVALAREEQRPLFVDFSAAWCNACKELETRTYPAVAAELHRFVLLRIDATNEDDPGVVERLRRYKIVGLPAVLLIDSKGNEVQRIDRYVEADFMRDALLRVR